MRNRPRKQPERTHDSSSAPANSQLGPGLAATLEDVLRCRELALPLALLDGAALERLATLARIHSVPAGTRIIRRGETGRSLYMLIEGRTCALQDTAAPHVLETHTPGAWFGEIGALVRVPRQADVIAEQAVTLLELPHAALPELLNNAAARAVLIELLLERVQRMK